MNLLRRLFSKGPQTIDVQATAIGGTQCPSCEGFSIFGYAWEGEQPYWLCEDCNEKFTLEEYERLAKKNTLPL